MPIIYDPSSVGVTTLEGLVQEVLLQLYGYTTRGEQITYVDEGISATDTRVRVDDISQVSRGTIEIGDELVRVASVDRDSRIAIVAPRGRGWRGTTAADHGVGETVTMSPLVPRVQIKRALNDTIGAIYPAIFAVADTTFTVDNPIKVGWEIPAEAEAILDVRWRDTFGEWQRVRTWELETRASAADFPSGKSLRLHCVPSHRDVQVVYATRPARLLSDSAPFEDSGLDESVRELIVLGAVARLIPALDVARLSVKSVNPDELDQPIQIGSAMSLSSALRKQYDQRLAEERQILLSRYPGRVHFTR